MITETAMSITEALLGMDTVTYQEKRLNIDNSRALFKDLKLVLYGHFKTMAV